MFYKYVLYWYNPCDIDYDVDFNIIVYKISEHNNISEAFKGVNEAIKNNTRSFKPITLTEEEVEKEFNSGKTKILITSQYKDECNIILKRKEKLN